MNRLRRNTKGFTLIELIVVLLLLSVILGLGGGALYRYTRIAKFRQNNESAQSLFSAAQSGMTHYKANGELESLDELCTQTYTKNTPTFGKVDIDSLKVDAAEQPGLTKYKNENRGLYYVILSKDTMEEREDRNLPDTVENRIYKMIEPYIYDREVFDGSICLEFDAQDGVVYSVSYCKQADDFTYDSGKDNPMSIDDRRYDSREELLLGYYYAGMLSARAPSDMEKPMVNNVALVNDETLSLRWNLSSAYKDLTGAFYYNIQIYDSKTNQVRLSMSVNKAEVENNTMKLKSGIGKDEQFVTCSVTSYDESGIQESEPKEYKFPAYVDVTGANKTPVMYLVLDAVDLGAQKSVVAQENEGATTQNNQDTYSFSRFGLKSGEIYARVQAAGEGYRSSSWKETNISHMYMASVAEGLGQKETLGIKNARHLYNVRFMEKEEALDSNVNTWEYVQHENFAWGGTQGILSHGNVYAGQKSIDDSNTAFPKIDTLDQNATYHGYGSQKSIEHMIVSEKKKDDEIQEATGLFGTNAGTIANVALTDANIQGANRTGGLCGVNTGSLSQVNVTGAVSGDNFVGGVVGQDAANSKSDERLYDQLSNEASVKGTAYVGGIVGNLARQDSKGGTGDKNRSSITDCKNTGAIQGTVGFVGGIVGYNDIGKLIDCNSTQKYTKQQLEEATSNLTGTCVGGLVGYQRGGVLDGCSTGEVNTPGYVIGRNFVGGIAGYFSNKEDKQPSSVDGDSQENGSNVLGESYVGGVVGANAVVDVDYSIEGNEPQISCSVNSGSSKNYSVENWSNRGIVLGKGNYAGGIVGFNTGDIEKCSTKVNIATTSGTELLNNLKEYNFYGNYVGGIAGYNNGDITTNKETSVVSVLYGDRFIGGLTGYNGPDGNIDTEYRLTGAYLDGNAFVGGFAGVNTSKDLVQEDSKDRKVKINRIEGGSFVGGYIGANIVDCGTLHNLHYYLNAQIDSSFGRVSGTSFVGGMVGYNQLTKNTFSNDQVLSSGRETLQSMDISSDSKVWDNTKNLFDSNDPVLVDMRIENQSPSLSSVEGSIFVGGMVGYNHKNTDLLLKDNENKTPIIATGEVSATDISAATNNYTFVGGMIGWARENVVIDNCVNDGSVDVRSSKGNYLGALTAVNSGEVKNCTTQNFGTRSTKKIGGLVGINIGSVNNSYLRNTVTGLENVGGLVSYNDSSGNMKDCNFSGTVRGYGDYSGGIVANNYGAMEDISMKDGSVRSNENHVGGIIGYNRGSLSGTITNTADCRVQGSGSVGGLIGTNNRMYNQSITATNHATVTSDGTYAGGIIGYTEKDGYSSAVLNNAKNYGTVTTSGEDGYAGGITSILLDGMKIEGCDDYEVVTALKGVNGGIVAINEGTVEDCLTKGSASSIHLRGANNCGGIAGINRSSGTISNSSIDNVMVTDVLDGNTGANIGGIAGTSRGQIKSCDSGTKAQNVEIGSYNGEGDIGGIAGNNTGNITKSASYSELDFMGNSASRLKGNIGGITGKNEGDVTSCEYQGKLQGYLGNSNGYGGIAGVNQEGTIDDCIVGKDAKTTIQVAGSANDSVKIGGIAGINKENATIANSHLRQVDIQTGYGYTGGVSGWNYGTIEKSGASKGTDAYEVEVTQTYGHLGGIVGKNEEQGVVYNCVTGNQWSIIAKNHAIDNTVAGIIGYNNSIKSMHGLKNYASVTKNGTRNGSINVISGVIGRQEVKNSNDWTLSNCDNYGEISGDSRVAGIIGQWKYNGGALEDCNNYGEIRSVTSLSGGIIGYIYMGTKSDTMRVADCENHGEIYCRNSYVGGVIGGIGSFSSGKVYVSQSINAGDLDGAYDAGGILGKLNDSSVSVRMNKCQNYGKKTGKTTKLCGIAGSKLAVVQDCFSVSDANYPIDSNGNSDLGQNRRFNYYFNNTDPSPEQQEGYSSVSATDTYQGNVLNLIDGDISDGSRWVYKNANGTTWNKSATLKFDFSRLTKIHEITPYWFTGSDKRTYNFKLYYYNASGERKQITSNGKSTFTGTGYPISNPKGDPVSFDEVQAVGYEIVIEKVNTYAYAALYEVEVNGSANKDMMIKYNNLPFKVSTGTKKAYEGRQEFLGASVDLSANPIGFSGTGNELYNKVHDEIYQFYYDLYRGQPDAPQNIQLSEDEDTGKYDLTWSEVKNAYTYRIELYEVDENGATKKLEPEYSKKVTVVPVNGKLSRTIPVEDEWQNKKIKAKVIAYNIDESLSAESWSNEVKVHNKKTLITPKIHYELIGTNESSAYKLVLDNPDAYEGMEDDVEITVDNSSQKKTFTVKDGGVSGVKFSATGGVSVTWIATPKSSISSMYKSSRSGEKQISPATMDMLKNTMINKAAFTGFMGDTINNLNYQVDMSSNLSEPLSWHERQELLMEDDDLGIPVVVSSGETCVSGGTQEVSLGDLPESIQNLSEVTVRSYPWRSTKADEEDTNEKHGIIEYGHTVGQNMTADKVKKSEAMNADGTLKNGYVVEKNSDGSFNVLYSIILGNEAFKVQRKEEVVSVPPSMPKPDVGCEPSSKDYYYDLSWDKDSTDANARYQVVATGITAGGERKKIYDNPDTGITPPIHEVEVKDEYGCIELELKVTRIGTKDSSGKTEKIGSQTTETFKLYPALSSIRRPTVQLENQNELNYNISWEEIESQIEKNQLKGYQVVICDVTGNVKEELPMVDSDKTSMENVDLDKYEGESIKIFVKALAKKGGDYRNSYLDNAADITVEKRLETPNINILSMSPIWAQSSSVDMEKLVNDGVTVSINDSDSTVSYLVDAKIEDEDGTVLKDFGKNNQTDNAKQWILNQGSESDWSGTYAGQYLKIKMRKTAPDAISSAWSEEKTFRIPRGKLADLSLAESTFTETVSESFVATSGGNTGTNPNAQVDLDAITFQPVDFANVYRVVATEADGSGTHEIWLRKDDNGNWQRKIITPVEKDDQGQDIEPVWVNLKKEEDTDAHTITYTEDDLKYSKNVTVESDGLKYTTKFTAQLNIVENTDRNTTQIQLALPDASSTSANYHDNAVRTTKKVVIQPMLLGEEDKKDVLLESTDFYAAGDPFHWLRTEENVGGETRHGIEIGRGAN